MHHWKTKKRPVPREHLNAASHKGQSHRQSKFETCMAHSSEGGSRILMQQSSEIWLGQCGTVWQCHQPPLKKAEWMNAPLNLQHHWPSWSLTLLKQPSFAQQCIHQESVETFGEPGVQGGKKELDQLHRRTCCTPVDIDELAPEKATSFDVPDWKENWGSKRKIGSQWKTT